MIEKGNENGIIIDEWWNNEWKSWCKIDRKEKMEKGWELSLFGWVMSWELYYILSITISVSKLLYP